MFRLLSLLKLKNRPRQGSNYSNPPHSSVEVGSLLNSTVIAEPCRGAPIITAEVLHTPVDGNKCCNRRLIESTRSKSFVKSDSNNGRTDKEVKLKKISAKNNSLIVSPQIIHFSMSHHVDKIGQRPASCEMTLYNPRTKRNSLIAFRIKINQLRVRGYTVRPNRGIVFPGQSEKVSIILTRKYHKKLLEMPSNIIDAINDKIIIQSCIVHKNNRYVESYLKIKEGANIDFDLTSQVRLSNSLICLFDDIDDINNNNNSELFTNNVVCVKLSRRRVDERLYELESIKHLLSTEEYQMKKEEIIDSI